MGDGINCGGAISSGSGNVIIGDTPYHSPVQGCATQSALNRSPLLGLSPMLAVPPVYAKSCLLDEGCTDAGIAEEPVENFGEMVLFAQSVDDDCCGYSHPDEAPEVVQHAQAAKKKKTETAATASPSPEIPLQESWYKTVFDLWRGADEKAVAPIPASKKITESAVENSVPEVANASTAVLSAGAVAGNMTQVWGSWSLNGVLSASRAVPYIGALASALYIPSAGEGSDKVPGRDEHWLEDELRRKGWAGETATTRVRFFWRPDIHGKMQVYGVHTGEGTPYEGVRVANMVWDANIQGYAFTPSPGVDGPTITWTPEKPEGADPISHTGSPVKPIDQPTILIYPIPEENAETTTPPFPAPDEHDFNDWILVFPDGSEIKPIYVYLSKPPVNLLDVDLYSNFKGRSRQGKYEADHMPSRAAVEAYFLSLYPELSHKDISRLCNDVAAIVIPKDVHQKLSETYGARNTTTQIELDSRNLRLAVDHNINAIKPALKEHGVTEGQIEAARAKLHKLNSEMGLYE